MIKKILKRIWKGPEYQKTYHSKILGEMIFNRDNFCWESKKKINDDEVNFIVGGTKKPDDKLIKALEEIAKSFNEFQYIINEFLKEQTQNAGEEILKLKISDIMYSRPDKPNNGMVFFRGTTNYKIWHCDLVKGKPKYLNYDK